MSDLGNKAIFSKNLKRYMNSAQINRRQLSDDLGMSYTTLCEWVSGKKYPRIDKIELLAQYFGITKSHLIEEQYEEIPCSSESDKLIKDMVEILKGCTTEQLEQIYNFVKVMCKKD